VLALERLGPHVGLVVSRVTNPALQPVGDLRLGLLDVAAQPGGVRFECFPYFGEFRAGPRLLPGRTGRAAASDRGAVAISCLPRRAIDDHE